MAKNTTPKAKEETAFQLSELEAQLIVDVLGRVNSARGAAQTPQYKAKVSILKKFAKIGYKVNEDGDGLLGGVSVSK